jgi:serine/threonine-protein kinase HipA
LLTKTSVLHGPKPTSATVRRFIENLLPKGRALDIAATIHKVSRNNIFGLVRELGAETAGALSLTAGIFEARDAESEHRLQRQPQEALQLRI